MVLDKVCPRKHHNKFRYRKRDKACANGDKRLYNASSTIETVGLHKGASIRYVPERLLGTGGLCEVVLAKDLLRLEHGDGKPYVAIKRLLPQYVQNPAARRLLAREFFILKGISHQGVVRAFDLHEVERELWLSMELLEGNRLYDAQGGKSFCGCPRILSLSAQLFDTLAVLHETGVVHGDIKPANLMLEQAGRLVLFDFNTADFIARPGRASSSANQALRSSFGLPSYSILYAAPERLKGESPSFSADVFSACCTIYELAEGHHPFNRHTAVEAKALGLQPSAMGMKISQFEKMILRGLSFEPEKRPTAQEVKCFFEKEKSILQRFLSLFSI